MINVDKIKLLQGDCLELMKDIPDKSIDLILCDLPYGKTNCKWDIIIPFEPLWEQYKRIIKDSRAILLFGSEPFSSHLRLSNIKEYKYDIIWQKTQLTGHLNVKYQPLKSYENISVFYKKPPTYNPQKSYNNSRKTATLQAKINCVKRENERDNIYKTQNIDNCRGYDSTERYPKDVICFAKDKTNMHPTQKPTALLEYLIKTYTNENDIVLDSCMGSGSTGEACLNSNRKFLGIEICENYYNTAVKRLTYG